MNVGTFTVLDDAGRACSLPNVPKERQWGEKTLHSVSLRPVTADAKTETEKSLNIPKIYGMMVEIQCRPSFWSLLVEYWLHDWLTAAFTAAIFS